MVWKTRHEGRGNEQAPCGYKMGEKMTPTHYKMELCKRWLMNGDG